MLGGKREGAGRKPGSRNKATADVKAAAQRYTAEALNTLAAIMRAGENEAARIAASKELLDRGYGKPHQTHETTIRKEPIAARLPAKAHTDEEWAEEVAGNA